jgi:hypothetical protein
VNSLSLTEKQQEVLWLRFGRKASIDQIARWLGITRRAVLSRLRNAKRRARGQAAIDFSELKPPTPKLRQFAISQISGKSAATPLDDL